MIWFVVFNNILSFYNYWVDKTKYVCKKKTVMRKHVNPENMVYFTFFFYAKRSLNHFRMSPMSIPRDVLLLLPKQNANQGESCCYTIPTWFTLFWTNQNISTIMLCCNESMAYKLTHHCVLCIKLQGRP